MNGLIKVANQNGKLVVSSREVAEHFEKRHNDVVAAIENKIKNLTTENIVVENYFIPSVFMHRGNTYDQYLLTRDGFSFIVMGFTGAKADLWKIKYIEAFNKMEASLKQAIPTMSQAELTAMIAQNQVEIERTANMALEVANRADKQINNALDVFASPSEKDWRESMNKKMRGMCEQYQLNYPTFYADLYQELEMTARADLQARLTRLRRRMASNGATKTACNRVTKLEVVERDPKLRAIFEGIVRKYQAKYTIESTSEEHV